MPEPSDVEALYRADGDRILATLIRLLHDFDLAEEMMQEAFVAALALSPRARPESLAKTSPPQPSASGYWWRGR